MRVMKYIHFPIKVHNALMSFCYSVLKSLYMGNLKEDCRTKSIIQVSVGLYSPWETYLHEFYLLSFKANLINTMRGWDNILNFLLLWWLSTEILVIFFFSHILVCFNHSFDHTVIMTLRYQHWKKQEKENFLLVICRSFYYLYFI